MPEQQKQQIPAIERMIQQDHFTEIMFIALITLCFIGDVLGDVSDHITMFYWLLMIPVFFVITFLNEQARELKTGKTIENFIKFNCLFWSSAFIAILLVFYLWHAGALVAQSAALFMHIILAHTMFLVGVFFGLRFYLIGLFLFLTAALTIAMEATVGITLFIAVPVLLLGFYFEKHKYIPSLKRKRSEDWVG